MKNKILKTIVIIIYITCVLLSLPISLWIVGMVTPAQFGETYYGVLPKMYRRLQETEGKRIIIIGNSAVAFGVQGELIESELDSYTVCPFGLYGSIGTKAMMDLARVNIKEDDIVLLAPELGPQSLSLYFNGDHLWQALDGNFDMLSQIKNEDVGSMLESYPRFLSQKYQYLLSGTQPKPQGVYAASSFNDCLTMIYDRPYNQMLGGFDAVERVSYDIDIFSQEFADYANEFHKFVSQKGATLLYAFTPVNVQGIKLGTTEKQIDDFYDYIDEVLDFEILGNPNRYIFESGWFYDSNVHMNNAGAIVYTKQLISDLKMYMGDYTNTDIEMPIMPMPPQEEETGENGKDWALFEYEETAYGYEIINLKEEGKERTSIEIPDFYNGKRVISFTENVFQNHTKLEEIYIGENVARILNDSFLGCMNLRRIYLNESMQPADCNVYEGLFNGTNQCKVYVPTEKMEEYMFDYWWSNHAGNIEGY